MEITKFSRFPRKDTTPRKKIVVLGRIQSRPCTQNPEVKLILQQKKELHGWKPDSEIHGWNGSCNTPQESVAYLHYYYKCADEKMCFLCEKTFMEYQNQPCGCTMWCSNCAKWVTNTLPHACIVCREEVVFLIEITAQSVQGGTREEALEFDVYNQGRFKTELRNKWQETGKHAYGDNHRFAQGITELRPINPGMFTTDLNPAMYKTEPWYSNNHQFAHGIMDLRPIKPGMLERIETELNPAMFKTEPWYGNNHQFAHGITDICPINRGMFERIETELNPAMFKTEPRYGNNHQFPHGITEMHPINPGMFTAMLNPAMLKTEPWYSNNHQFAHGIMGPINPGMFTTELKPGLFQTEPWNGDNCQLAHWINEKPPVHLGTFKTELFNKWQETGSCPYGDKCQFAHGITELRPVIRHPSYKTEVCRTFLASNTCPYGHRCHFRHSLAE